MAYSTKGTGSFLFPLAVVAAAVVVAIAVTFTISGEEPPDEATVISEDANPDERPAGGGTVPEGSADEEVEGVGDEVGEVDPAAPDADSVPAAEQAAEGDGAGSDTEGASSADENVAGAAEPPVAEEEPAGDQAGSEQSAGPETGEAAQPAPEGTASGAEGSGTGTTESGNETDEEVDFGTEGGADQSAVDDPEAEGFPEGRDAQTELNPDPGQEVVEDDDEGGTAFVPTPSGPEGRAEDDDAN